MIPAPVIRIILRVIAGIMIGYGLPKDWADQIVTDPDALFVAETIVGALLWAATEAFYIMAKRFGWKT
ncbi:hypothetical protein GCM10007908_03860 [Rhizobium albus]|jgi:hypothetical protein|nr:hypothetical protein GCM10007908_03860 [Rhizobium albus]